MARTSSRPEAELVHAVQVLAGGQLVCPEPAVYDDEVSVCPPVSAIELSTPVAANVKVV
jgi:hypothetical protein